MDPIEVPLNLYAALWCVIAIAFFGGLGLAGLALGVWKELRGIDAAINKPEGGAEKPRG